MGNTAISLTCTYPKCLTTTAVGCQGACRQSQGLEGIIPDTRADLSPSPEVVKELVEALRITRDRLLSHLHNELDGVWSEQDFLDEVKEADAVLAKLEGGE